MKTLKIGDLLAKVPIVQGGMGVGISLSGLASAVANAGGVGVISSAGLGVIYKEYSNDFKKASIYGLREELRKARELTRGIVGVNIMVALTNFADYQGEAIVEYVPFLGDPDKPIRLSILRVYNAGDALELTCYRGVDTPHPEEPEPDPEPEVNDNANTEESDENNS